MLKLVRLTSRRWKVPLYILGVLVFLILLFKILETLYPENTLLSGGYFVNLFFTGIVLGSVYALIALGYTMVYGVIQLINFAHGDIYMLGSYIGYFFLRVFIKTLYFDKSVPLWVAFFLAMIISMALCAVAGVLMEKFAYLPLRKSTRIAALITAVGMSLLLENLGIIVFTPNPRSFAPNTFIVYTVEVDESGAFDSPRRITIDQNPRVVVPFEGEAFVRVKARSQAGESGWSATAHLAGGGVHSVGEFEDYPTKLEDGMPAPAGLILSRGDEAGSLEVKWAGLPKVFRDIAPVFDEKPMFVPLDFGLGAGKVDESKRLGIWMTRIHIIILVTTIIVLAGLWWLISRTRFGIAMRAVSFDKEITRLMGIDTNSVISLTFALGSALAAVAGCLVGLYLIRIDPLMGILPGIKAFVAAVIGGIGSIPGAAAGGLIMGVSETLVKGYIPFKLSPLSDAVAFAFLIVVLLFRPLGLFGRAAKEKV